MKKMANRRKWRHQPQRWLINNGSEIWYRKMSINISGGVNVVMSSKKGFNERYEEKRISEKQMKICKVVYRKIMAKISAAAAKKWHPWREIMKESSHERNEEINMVMAIENGHQHGNNENK
jgi:hypothetical protein